MKISTIKEFENLYIQKKVFSPFFSYLFVEYYLTLEYLFNDFQFFFIDTRGSGQSDAPKSLSDYQYKNFCSDYEAIRKYFNFDKINFIGHSYGGILAMEYAIRYPESIDELFVLCSYAENDSDYYKRYSLAVDEIKKHDWFKDIKDHYDGFDNINNEDDLNKCVLGILLMYFYDQNTFKSSLHLFKKGHVSLAPYKSIQGCYPGYSANLLDRIHKIQAATKIICGSHDFICPAEDYRRIHRGIKS